MQADPTHHIDRHILKVLTFQKSARYRDMRPPNTDSNLFNYHRKTLLKQGYIVQNSDNSYSLGSKGYRLAEKATFEDLRVRERPKLAVVYLLLNEKGELAAWDKAVQPYIDTLNLPNGKMRLEDASVSEAAERMLLELVPEAEFKLDLVGVADVCVLQRDEVITHTVNMVAQSQVKAAWVKSELIKWIKPADFTDAVSTPGAADICKDFLATEEFIYKNYIINL